MTATQEGNRQGEKVLRIPLRRRFFFLAMLSVLAALMGFGLHKLAGAQTAWFIKFPTMAGLSALLFGTLWLALGCWRTRLIMRANGWCMVVFMCACGGAGLALFINATLDSGEVAERTVAVIGVSPHKSGGEIEVRLEDGNLRSLDVPASVFDTVKETCTAKVYTSPGFLRMPWIRAIEAADESHRGTCKERTEGR